MSIKENKITEKSMLSKDGNIHKDHRKRVKSRFLKKGIDVFDDYQALEFLLFYSYPRIDTNPIGHRLIKEFKTLEGVFNAEYEELIKVDGVGPEAATFITFIGQLRNKIKYDSLKEEGVKLDSTAFIGYYCMNSLSHLRRERLMLLCLNEESRLISRDIISTGVANATSADIRSILEIALKRDASGIILAHNHPGGNSHPSKDDITVTNSIVDLLSGINVTVVDHIICGDSDFCSLSERGLLKQAGI